MSLNGVLLVGPVHEAESKVYPAGTDVGVSNVIWEASANDTKFKDSE